MSKTTVFSALLAMASAGLQERLMGFQEPQMCVGLDARRRQNPDGFTCNDGSIIPWTQVCDGEAQCDCKCDESDAICVDNPPPSPSPTPVDGFTCNDGSIIPWAQVCDGEPQCDCECDETESACKLIQRRRAETLTPALPVSQIDDQTPEEVLGFDVTEEELTAVFFHVGATREWLAPAYEAWLTGLLGGEEATEEDVEAVKLETRPLLDSFIVEVEEGISAMEPAKVEELSAQIDDITQEEFNEGFIDIFNILAAFGEESQMEPTEDETRRLDVTEVEEELTVDATEEDEELMVVFLHVGEKKDWLATAYEAWLTGLLGVEGITEEDVEGIKASLLLDSVTVEVNGVLSSMEPAKVEELSAQFNDITQEEFNEGFIGIFNIILAAFGEESQ